MKLTRQPDGSVLASGPNPALTTYTITAVSPLRGITGVRIDALVDPSLPKTGPGRDAYGHFRITGLQVEIAPASQSQLRPSRDRSAPAASLSAGAQALRFKTMKVDDFAIPFKPEDLLVEGSAHTAKNGAWTITAIRDTTRVARHAVLVPDAPFGFAEGTRITVRIDHLDGTIGQGLGRFRLALTTAADPLVGADVPARLRPLLDVAAADRRKSDAADLTAFFLSRTPLLAPARQAITTARRQLVDLQIPLTLVMERRPRSSGHRTSSANAAASPRGVRASTPARRRPCMPCVTTSRRTGWDWRDG